MTTDDAAQPDDRVRLIFTRRDAAAGVRTGAVYTCARACELGPVPHGYEPLVNELPATEGAELHPGDVVSFRDRVEVHTSPATDVHLSTPLERQHELERLLMREEVPDGLLLAIYAAGHGLRHDALARRFALDAETAGPVTWRGYAVARAEYHAQEATGPLGLSAAAFLRWVLT